MTIQAMTVCQIKNIGQNNMVFILIDHETKQPKKYHIQPGESQEITFFDAMPEVIGEVK